MEVFVLGVIEDPTPRLKHRNLYPGRLLTLPL
jgi:hypothetical protein